MLLKIETLHYAFHGPSCFLIKLMLCNMVLKKAGPRHENMRENYKENADEYFMLYNCERSTVLYYLNFT